MFKAKMDALLSKIGTCCTRGCKTTKIPNLQQWEKDQIHAVIDNLLHELDHYVKNEPVFSLKEVFGATREADMLCRVIFQIEQAIRDLPRGGVRDTLGIIWGDSSDSMRRGANCILYNPTEQQQINRTSLDSLPFKPHYDQLCEDKPNTLFQKTLGERFYL